MNFKTEKPIYQQIIELIEGRIGCGTWAEGERIPSVRDLGTEFEVNPNTVMRAFERLCMAGVIETSRGVGYSVCKGACNTVRAKHRGEFLSETLPAVFEQMEQLDITLEQIHELYRNRL